MPGTLDGVQAKVARAEANLQILEAEQQRWLATSPFRIRPEVDRSFAGITNIVFYVDEVAAVPLTFSTIIGDVLYDLRSALDHLAWQLVLANGGTPGRDTYFPIYDSPTGPRGGPRPFLVGIDPAALAIIEKRQPYHLPGGPATAPLWRLSELCNHDKHRLLLVVGLAYEAVSVSLVGHVRWIKIDQPMPLVAGQYLSTLALPDADPAALDVANSPKTLLAFGPGQAGAGEPIVPLVRSLKDEVEDVVNSLSSFMTP